MRPITKVNQGFLNIYTASSDWMVRNFDHRFEVACPIYDKSIQQEIMDILQIQLADNIKSRYINIDPNNQYKEKSSKKEDTIRSQISTYEYLKK